MAWVRIPPLPRSFVPPKRRLLFAAGSRPAGRGAPEHHLAERRAALGTAALTAALWLRNAGGEAECGARSAPTRLPVPSPPPGSRPSACPGLLPALSRTALPAVPSLRPGEEGLRESFDAKQPSPGRCDRAGPPPGPAAGRHHSGLTELHVPFYFPSYAVTQPMHNENLHRVSSAQPTGVIHSREPSTRFPCTFLSSLRPRAAAPTPSPAFLLFSIGEALWAVPCVPSAAPRALQQSAWKDV